MGGHQQEPTLGETRSEESRNLLDQGIGGDERIVLAGQLLNQLLVLVKLLQIVRRHSVNTMVLGTIDIVLITQNTAARTVSLSNTTAKPTV